MKVWNQRDKHRPVEAVYVGRPTVWGNPYTLARGRDRSVVLAKYLEYLLRNPALMARARRELKGKDLVCWCAPLPCHADILMAVANNWAMKFPPGTAKPANAGATTSVTGATESAHTSSSSDAPTAERMKR